MVTVNAGKILKGHVVLMIAKQFCTFWYAVGGEDGLTGKTRAWGDVCAQN